MLNELSIKRVTFLLFVPPAAVFELLMGKKGCAKANTKKVIKNILENSISRCFNLDFDLVSSSTFFKN